MGESYVRPVTGSSEPQPGWVAVWRFRGVVILLLLAFVLTAVWFFRRYIDPNREQDPDFDSGLRVVATRSA